MLWKWLWPLYVSDTQGVQEHPISCNAADAGLAIDGETSYHAAAASTSGGADHLPQYSVAFWLSCLERVMELGASS